MDKLTALENKFKRLLNATSDAVCQIDKNGNILFYNNQFLSLLKIKENISNLPNLFDFFDENTNSKIKEIINNKSFDYKEREISLSKKDCNDIIWVKINSDYYYDENQNLIDCLLIITDITKNKILDEKLKESEQRYRLLAENSTDLIAKHTKEGTFTYISPASRFLLGYEPEELIGKSIYDLFHPEDLQDIKNFYSVLLNLPDIYTITYRIKRKDDTYIWFETTSRSIRDNVKGEVIEIIAISRDITQRKQMEDELCNINRTLKILSSANKTLIRSNDISSFLNEVCKIVVEMGGYKFVWIGIVESNAVNPIAWAGFENGYLSKIELTISDTNKYPAIKAITTSTPQIIKNILYDPTYEDLRQEVKSRGFLSSISLPVSSDSKILGSLTIYSGNLDAFDEDETNLLSELAMDIGYGITLITTRNEREKAQRSLIEAQEKYKSIYENAVEGIFQSTLEGKFLSVNPSFARILGYSNTEELINNVKDIQEQLYVNPENRKIFLKKIEDFGAVSGFETQLYKKDKTVIWVSVNARLVKDEDKKTQYLEGTLIDITFRKKAEQALKESEEKYKNLVELSPEAIAVHSEGKIVFANKVALELMGAKKPEDLIGKSIMEIVHPQYREIVKTRVQQMISEKKSVPLIEEKFITLDGKEIDVEVAASPMMYNDKQALQVVVRNITQRNEAERAIKKSIEKLKKIVDDIINAMGMIVETKDPYTAGHQRRVTNLAIAIAMEMSLSEDIINKIRMAGLIHDLGKIYVPSEILSKPGKLSTNEFSLIKAHPQVGYDIIKQIELPSPVAKIVLQHHERLNGSGYPYGLFKEDILLESRIISVADVVEAMASFRPYRPSLGIDKALEEISNNKGILYDNDVVDICIRLFTKLNYQLV